TPENHVTTGTEHTKVHNTVSHQCRHITIVEITG
ncbi:hypothetical protein VN97_g12287, partial [Penicillium thymicola]